MVTLGIVRTQTLVTHFCPLWLTIWSGNGPKYGYFWGQNPASMAGWFQGEDPIWKVFYVPYHTPMHRTNLGTNLQISGVKIRPQWQAVSRSYRPTWKVSCAPYHTPANAV